MPSPAFLIDAPVYVFRAYHSLPPMQAPDGTPTNAAYGFTNTLLKWLDEERPSHVAVTFDHSWESFRNQLEPDYKAQRGEPPTDLEPQLPLCAEAARALGLTVTEAPGYEADDCIATLASRLAEGGRPVRVVSTDKDLAQLVREDGLVQLFDLARARLLDAAGVRARFGVNPSQIPDYLGLVGDAVDNLPGVPGIGPKTAAALLGAFGRVEAIPAHPAAWGELGVRGAERRAAALAAHRARAIRTRELATLVREVPDQPTTPEELVWRGADRERVSALFGRLGWSRIAERIPRWAE